MSDLIAFHTRHDANLVVAREGRIVLILELERLFNQRYFAYSLDPETFRQQLETTLETVEQLTGTRSFDTCVLNWIPEVQQPVLREVVEARRFVETTHHRAHAAGAYHLSPFGECLIFSIDGGGNDGWFNIFEGRRGRVRLLERLDLNLGTPYRFLGNFIAEIRSRKGWEFLRGLDIAGKLMGLAAYGNPDPQLHAAARRALLNFREPTDLRAFAEEVEIPFEIDVLQGQRGRDLAHNVQAAIEEILEELFRQHHTLSESRNVCLTGGVALNVIANSNLARKFPEHNFYVPANSNDCGIAFGSLLDLFPKLESRECAWDGLPLLDPHYAPRLREEFAHRPASPEDVVDALVQGQIVGLVQGRSEHGPRALGNRSFLALPGYPNIKDILNQKVKFREPYRPFAPLVSTADVDTYFDLPALSPYMSFAAVVREEHRQTLAGVTHADNTSRVQTLEQQDNPFVYQLLQIIKSRDIAPVLLNTSLNIRGRPIAARLEDTAEILRDTELDWLYYEGELFEKRG